VNESLKKCVCREIEEGNSGPLRERSESESAHRIDLSTTKLPRARTSHIFLALILVFT